MTATCILTKMGSESCGHLGKRNYRGRSMGQQNEMQHEE